MTAQETSLLNAFETTLTGTIGASDLTFTVNSVTDSASNTLAAPCYLILNPDSATNREVVLVTSVNAGTKTLTLDNINKRYLTGSAATSGLSHASGSVVRMSPVQQHIEDINDRVDTLINEAGTAVNTSLFLDEDDMSSNSATKGVTQQSVKAYVDTQLTAEDLDFAGDSGTGAVDLDSQTFTIAGTTNEIETSASGQTLTIGLPSSITVNVTGALTGNASTATALETARTIGGVSFDGTGNIDLPGVNTAGNQNTSGTAAGLSATLAVSSGGTGATSLTDGGVLLGSGTGAVTATSVLTNGQLLIGDGTGDPTVGTLTEGSNVTITNGAGSITIASTDTNTTYTAGDGLDLTGTTFSTDLKANGGLVIESTELALDLGASSITGSLDAAKIADGSVSNTEFQYLDGVTSDIQTQLNAKGDVTASSTTTFTNKTIDADGTGNSITNIEDANIKSAAAIDASKIADGSVSNAEFQRLDGVTSDIQTQLDGKQASGSYITASSTDTLTNKTLGAVTLSGTVTGGDQEINAVVLKDYAETDVAVTSSSGVVSINLANGNTGSITLTENITDIDFTNVPTNGVSTFTLQITQHASSAKTVAINAVTVNGGGNVTAKTAGGSGYTVSTGASAIDLVTFLFLDAGTPLLNALQDFS